MRNAHVAAAGLILFACNTVDDLPEVEPYPQCDASSTNLASQAATYDAIARRLHIQPGQNLLHAAITTSDYETFDRVRLSDNSGFWTATYVASQAYRYRVSGDAEALENLKRTLQGMLDLTRITGKPGLFGRSYVKLGLPGFPTEAELVAQYPDCPDFSAGQCKRWNRVDDGPYAGHMWKNDVSRDEYAGHMFAVGIVGKLVDDAEVQDTARAIASEVALHLIDNDMQFKDVSGETTTFGFMSPTSFGGFPGFLAVQTLAWFATAADLTQDPRITSFYRNCLLREDIEQCEKPDLATSESYLIHLRTMGLNLDCKTNWNNHNMAQLAMFDLLQTEEDGRTRRIYQQILEDQMWAADDPRPMKDQKNTLYTFFHEVNRNPALVERDEARVETGLCVLKKFPEVKYRRAVDHSRFTEQCRGRKDFGMSTELIPYEERLVDNFSWTRNPYQIRDPIEEDRTYIESPEDFLLAYWMGRYFGMIDEDT
ncbi:MAG: hypothetical protein RMA76_03755 [Deltaproteobacteria bacterium]|jgi:hypothetical protein